MKRKNSLRLSGYDYSQSGGYFVTICVDNHESLFGIIENDQVILSDLGITAKEFWLQIAVHNKNVELDEFIVMPNHLHGIILLFNEDTNVKSKAERNIEGVLSNAPTEHFSRISPAKDSLSKIIRSFKGSFTAWCRKNGYGDFRWQRSFNDRVIRNETELDKIREYILYNPLRWKWDNENQDKI